MGELAGVRAELVRGDLRVLYLAWLAGLACGELDDDAEEPPVPPGLSSLSAPLRSLIEFLRIDGDLLTAAAEASASQQAKPAGLAAWISELPASDKDALLVRAAQGEHAVVAAGLVRRFRRQARQATDDDKRARRTVAELQDRAQSLRQARVRERAKRPTPSRLPGAKRPTPSRGD